jgi:hypothetical protein
LLRQYPQFMGFNHLFSQSKDLPAATAACRYLNELVNYYGQATRAIAKAEKKPELAEAIPEVKSQIEKITSHLFEEAQLYFALQNRTNKTDYPLTFAEFSSQRLGVQVAKEQPQDKPQGGNGAEGNPSNP